MLIVVVMVVVVVAVLGAVVVLILVLDIKLSSALAIDVENTALRGMGVNGICPVESGVWTRIRVRPSQQQKKR